MRSLAILLLISPLIHAVPPSVTSLFPSGGQRGTTVTVTLQGKVEPWPPTLWTPTEGIKLEPDPEKGRIKVTIGEKVTPGRHRIRIANAEDATPLLPLIVGHPPELSETEPNNDFLKPNAPESQPVTINGRLSPSQDVDCFGLDLKKGQTLVAAVRAHSLLDSPMDAILQVLDSKGFVLEQSHDFRGLDPQIIFEVPESATYIVRLFCFPAQPNSTIGFAGGADHVYRLTLTTEGLIDHSYPLALNPSSPEPVEPRGWHIPPALRDLKPEALRLHHPRLALSAELIPVHSPVYREEQAEERFPLTPPFAVSGYLAKPEETDAFPLRTKKGEKLLFEVRARELHSPVDPVLIITDAKGKELKRMDDLGSRRDGPRDARLEWTAPADGVCQARVEDLHRRGSERHFYLLRVAPLRPEVTATVDKDRFVVEKGKELEIPITLNRQNGYAERLELRAEGLPEEVVVMAPVSEPKGETAKTIKVKLSSKVKGSYPFRWKLGSKEEIPVRLKGKESDWFWLTVK